MFYYDTVQIFQLQMSILIDLTLAVLLAKVLPLYDKTKIVIVYIYFEI